MTNVAESVSSGAGGGGGGDPTSVLTGTIADVTFEDAELVGENGVLLSGRTRALGPGIVFRNVSLRVGVLHNCTCAKGDPAKAPTGCRDYRPTTEPQVVCVSQSHRPRPPP
jgi:hypothetical protein